MKTIIFKLMLMIAVLFGTVSLKDLSFSVDKAYAQTEDYKRGRKAGFDEGKEQGKREALERFSGFLKERADKLGIACNANEDPFGVLTKLFEDLHSKIAALEAKVTPKEKPETKKTAHPVAPVADDELLSKLFDLKSKYLEAHLLYTMYEHEDFKKLFDEAKFSKLSQHGRKKYQAELDELLASLAEEFVDNYEETLGEDARSKRYDKDYFDVSKQLKHLGRRVKKLRAAVEESGDLRTWVHYTAAKHLKNTLEGKVKVAEAKAQEEMMLWQAQAFSGMSDEERMLFSLLSGDMRQPAQRHPIGGIDIGVGSNPWGGLDFSLGYGGQQHDLNFDFGYTDMPSQYKYGSGFPMMPGAPYAPSSPMGMGAPFMDPRAWMTQGEGPFGGGGW